MEMIQMTTVGVFIHFYSCRLIVCQAESVAMRQVLAEELDLEIALRQRLLNAVESRITWALLLQESLMKDANGKSEKLS